MFRHGAEGRLAYKGDHTVSSEDYRCVFGVVHLGNALSMLLSGYYNPLLLYSIS